MFFEKKYIKSKSYYAFNKNLKFNTNTSIDTHKTVFRQYIVILGQQTVFFSLCWLPNLWQNCHKSVASGKLWTNPLC